MLRLRGETVLVDLLPPVVIEVVEHQIQIIIHFLRQMIHYPFLSIDDDFDIILLNHGGIVVALVVVLRWWHFSASLVIAVHVVAEGAGLWEI